MVYYKEYIGHQINLVGKRKKIDNTVYSFDIESTSYIILNGKQYPAIKYKDLNEKQKENCEFRSTMYIWMLSINDIVYYGRTWEEFRDFLNILENYSSYKKIIFIHNLSFEFQFLKSVFNFKNVLARKSHKVMKCDFIDYNIELRCTYFMSNCALKYLPKLFNLPVKKMVGDLEYEKIRHSKTKLTKKELKYCENDCMVIYYYILEELKTYERVDKIPLTSTGHVRRELKNIVMNDYNYRNKVRRSINTDPHIYNLLMDCFAGRLYSC